jgi:protocatechuate 3,4-dioxygenase beta subunit
MEVIFMLKVLAVLAMVLVSPSTQPTSAPAGASGTVVGTIVDTAGQPVADCLVTLQQNAQKMREPLQTATDDKGKFKFEKVPPGAYNLNARTRDAKGKAIKSLKVVADKTIDIGTLKLKMK